MDPNSTSSTTVEPAPAPAAHRVVKFTTRRLPWLFGMLMLGVYALTLNHWVSSDSVSLVANLEGLNLSAGLAGPVTYALTYPFGWLPAEWIPLAVNLSTAICAALSLALLVRSVALLPHNLEKVKVRRRRRSPPRILTIRTAWIPPLLAGLVCGLQLSFWQNAITATGEMLNLLMFAFVVRCFMEFHYSRKDRWLLAGSLVYGLAVANDWAMAAFLPAFFVALVWIKRIFVFNEAFLKRLLKHPRSFRWRLLWQIPGCFLLGLSIFLLLPTLASQSGMAHLDFWPALKQSLHTYRAALTHFPRQVLVTSCLVSVMPLFLIGIRFYQFVAGFNRLNFVLGSIFFNVAYGFFLLLCVWTMFDSPVSPRRLGLGLASLPFYFLGALSIGYFVGHFLLIAEIQQEAPKRKRRRRTVQLQSDIRRRQLQAAVLWSKRTILAGVTILAIGIPTALVCKNLPVIAIKRTDPCGEYITQVEQALPPDGGVVIGTDAFRLAYLETALIRDGRQISYLLLNIEGLEQSPDYLRFVKASNPGFNLDFNLPDPADPGQRREIPMALLRALSGSHAIYSLLPAPRNDPIAEFFYFQPRGLIAELRRFQVDRAFADPTPPEVIKENEDFWRDFATRQFPELNPLINPPQPKLTFSLYHRFVNTLRFWPEADRSAVLAGEFYAIALNDWGVELQGEGRFPEAKDCFAQALELNAHNNAAQINQKFNADYLANRQETMQRPLETAKSMNEYRDWRHVVRDGAVDDPNFCYMLGAIMADNHLARPAIAQLQRVRELSPSRLDTYLSLGRLFDTCGDFTNELLAANEMLAISPTNTSAWFMKASALAELKNYSTAITLLDQVLALSPGNSMALLLKANAYVALTNAAPAIQIFDQVLAAEPGNIRALLGRGAARRQQGDLAAAWQDFSVIVKTSTNAFPAYLNLAEIADAQTNHPAAITNYELFLKYAPPNLREVARVEKRLQDLQPATP
jgi:tetratricopeptide (TPR) repeat protein